MYIYVCVCMYVCMLEACTFTYTCTHTYILVHTHITHACIHVYIPSGRGEIDIHIRTFMYIYIH